MKWKKYHYTLLCDGHLVKHDGIGLSAYVTVWHRPGDPSKLAYTFHNTPEGAGERKPPWELVGRFPTYPEPLWGKVHHLFEVNPPADVWAEVEQACRDFCDEMRKRHAAGKPVWAPANLIPWQKRLPRQPPLFAKGGAA